ncbi:MAG: NAD(P)-dependent alcohol dehydrogenase [Myxococcota bacterium]
MRAVYYEDFGPPSVLRAGERPDLPLRTGWVRVRVEAAALNPKDILVRKGKMRWLVRGPFPRIPGYDIAGRLIDPVPGLPADTPVFGMIQTHAGGGCAELASLRPDWIAGSPSTLSAQEAAGLPLAGLTALQALRDELGVETGDRLLVNGASGGVGTLAVQVGKALGAEVIGVCSGRNAEIVRELGADRIIDYTAERVEDERDLDHIFDVFGSLPWARARPLLGRQGRYCTAIPRPFAMARGALRRLQVHRAALVVVRSRRRDLEQLARWVDEGKLRPVVDQVVRWTHSERGHARLETKRARGKVIVDFSPCGQTKGVDG